MVAFMSGPRFRVFESKSGAFCVVDVFAPAEEQPAIQSSWNDREDAEDERFRLEWSNTVPVK